MIYLIALTIIAFALIIGFYKGFGVGREEGRIEKKKCPEAGCGEYTYRLLCRKHFHQAIYAPETMKNVTVTST